MKNTVLMFVNGQAMSGGRLNGALTGAKFLGSAETAPLYSFYSVRGEFPGLFKSRESCSSIPGELYEVTYHDLRELLLPREPRELELSTIELLDGSGCLSMVMRADSIDLPGVKDISDVGGWRKFLEG